MKNPGVVIIGSGFAGLSAACFLAKAGKKVTVLEQHEIPGGRARQFQSAGFTFDMGPSWYWMPDVMERFFNQFDKSTSDYFSLQRLDPSYRVYWEDGPLDIPANYDALRELFEKLEPGSGPRLDAFLKEAAFKYSIGMQKLVYKPGKSLLEFADLEVIKGLFKLDVFTSVKKHIYSRFRHPKLRQLLEFPILFLGALPEDTPALYTLMNYADIKLGTWYPSDGMYSLVRAMHDLAVSLGVRFHFGNAVQKLEINQGQVSRVITEKSAFEADVVISNADYHFTETQLLDKEYRSYSDKYWQQRTMAPSCLIFFVGLNKRIKHLVHHSLFFDVPFDSHAAEIYRHPSWPTAPLFYVSCTSKSDAECCAPRWRKPVLSDTAGGRAKKRYQICAPKVF